MQQTKFSGQRNSGGIRVNKLRRTRGKKVTYGIYVFLSFLTEFKVEGIFFTKYCNHILLGESNSSSFYIFVD